MKKILIIDDDPGIVKVVKFRLVKMGYEVLVAIDGKEGLDKAMAIKPDLVILDYFMPLLNGNEVCKRIKAEDTTKHIPVILMTASIQQDWENQLREIRADDTLLKPFESEKFLEKINKYVG